MQPQRATTLRTTSGFRLHKWAKVPQGRVPWLPPEVAVEIDAWTREVAHATKLVDAGEKVMPLLLAGETRCGKTSSLCAIAHRKGMAVNRLSLGGVVGSHMGDCAGLMAAAFEELRNGYLADDPALWLIDEIDGVAQARIGESSAGQERAHALACMLTEIENLPPKVMLAATSNTIDLMDAAVVGRFAVVEWPKWEALPADQRRQFAASHGLTGLFPGTSYAEAVRLGRRARVQALIG